MAPPVSPLPWPSAAQGARPDRAPVPARPVSSPGECFDVVPVFQCIVIPGEGFPENSAQTRQGIPSTAPLSPQKFRAGVEQIFTGQRTIQVSFSREAFVPGSFSLAPGLPRSLIRLQACRRFRRPRCCRHGEKFRFRLHR